MRKNNVKKKRKNIFEILGIKQDNKKWITLTITLLLMAYLIFCLTYAPISCVVNIKANAEEQQTYVNVYTTNASNEINITLPTIYTVINEQYVEVATKLTYNMQTTNENLILTTPNDGINTVENISLGTGYVNGNRNYEGIKLKTIGYEVDENGNTITNEVEVRFQRTQEGVIDITKMQEIRTFQFIGYDQTTQKIYPIYIGFQLWQDNENYINYNIQAYEPNQRIYFDVVNKETYINIYGKIVYNEGLNGNVAREYWYQYFKNNNTFRDDYKAYWYDYYYQSIYNKGLEAGRTYSEMDFYTLIDAITFGAIKPIYSILNFNLLGINLWNLATSIFTILIVVIIIKFIGMVV